MALSPEIMVQRTGLRNSRLADLPVLFKTYFSGKFAYYELTF